MAPGIVLFIIGAIFTFAIRSDGSWIDTRVLGVILMLGGVAFAVRSRLKRHDAIEEEVAVEHGAADDGTTTLRP
jgi:hypothetical protein